MQLMADAVTVLGSRHGLLWDPIHRRCKIIRFEPWGDLAEIELRAGVVLEGRELTLPLCADGDDFFFLDQRISPCTMSLIGIDPGTMTKLKLTVATPFRPRDADFSTRPVLALRLTVEKLPGSFRWTKRTSDPETIRVFLEVRGEGLNASASGDASVDLTWTARPRRSPKDPEDRLVLHQHDRLLAPGARREGHRLLADLDFRGGRLVQSLDVFWCTHSEPVFEVQGQCLPFRYDDELADLDAVAAWAADDGASIFENAQRVDAVVARNNGSRSLNNLLAQTLHSWLGNTWWVRGPEREIFTVWEGSCHFHSTVDVEFTQSPFYLAAWPELLALQLDFWPAYSKDGYRILDEAGKDTLFLSHDTGAFLVANQQAYPHDMAVEETANYVILAFAHWRRTGRADLVERHADTIQRYLEFIAACDTTGNGVPDQGCANTIDDASPAIQFGREQIYLGVKALAAFVAGARILDALGRAEPAAVCRERADRIRRTIREKGWTGDHFVTLLNKEAKGLVNPWNGEVMDAGEVPGWDAAHIYTANGLPPLDMVGLDVGLDPERLRTDLRVATERCLRQYGCIHTEYETGAVTGGDLEPGLAGAARSPGWIAMNLLRDLAAFYRGVDLRYLADRYWEWQVLTNTQQPALFFETFGGNNLHCYPRGVAVWGVFDALAGLAIDQVEGTEKQQGAIEQVRVPRLFDADWEKGNCQLIET
jgi:hypothetical protein